MNYYNEFDVKAAAWLRELIAAGLIPEGVVDERSIADVGADELSGYAQCHFFAGIGGWAYALRLAGWPDDRPVWTGSCPCQPFSCAGKGRGEDDPRHLWPEFRRLIGECRPSVVFGEQVASKAGRLWLGGVRSDLEALGYAVGAADLCAAGVGAPHIRQRLYWVAQSESGERDNTGQTCGQGREPVDSWADGIRPGNGQNVPGWSGAGSAYSGVADPEGTGRGVCNTEDNGQADAPSNAPTDSGNSATDGRGPDIGGVADSNSRGCLEHMQQQRGQKQDTTDRDTRGEYAGGCGEDGGVADTTDSGARRPGQTQQGGNGENHGVSRQDGGEGGGVADRGESGLERLYGPENMGREQPGCRQEVRPVGPCLSSHWSASTFHLCRDGKQRRIPTEPSLFPLAHGVPGRVGLLRGAGNAIVPQCAEAFIRAVIIDSRY